MPSSALLSASDIQSLLQQAPVQGKRLLEPLKTRAKETGFPVMVLEDHQIEHTMAEVHRGEDDLWLCLEGEATFVCGGELKDAVANVDKDGRTDEQEWKGRIEGGIEYVLKPGDWLWIPAGEPHQHSATGTARLAIIKIPKRAL